MNIDNNILDVFSDLGLTYDLIPYTKITTTNYSKYNFLFVGDEHFTQNIPVNDYPFIVANSYFGTEWGLVDREGISSLASSSPLQIKVDNRIYTAYTQATFGVGKPSIPFYFLQKLNKEPEMIQKALTFSMSSGTEWGDVVSYAPEGITMLNNKVQKANLCFYGIFHSDYWTPISRQLFEDCIDFVSTGCDDDSDCPASFTSGVYCNGDEDVYRYYTEYTCENPGTADSECVAHTTDEMYKDCEEDYCDSYGNDYCIGNDVYHSRDCYDFSCSNESVLNCIMDTDSEEELVRHCIGGCLDGECVGFECSEDSDCGIDSYIGNLYCSQDDVYQIFQEWKCVNPGTESSYCNAETSPHLIEECSDICIEGACAEIVCHNNTDCEDGIFTTRDTCVNPGELNSYCVHEDIMCSQETDCGYDRNIGVLYCQNNDVYRDFLDFRCANQATPQSSCSTDIDDRMLYDCEYVCANGNCIRCITNPDCADSDARTDDICWFGGTTDSYCTHEIITCLNDLECGTDGLIDGVFCSNDDRYQIYRTYNCINEGTIGSYCDIDESPQLIEECAYSCVNRTCVNCIDTDGDGYNATGGLCGIIDCNDNDNQIYPGAAELCDSIDNDCDSEIDEDFTDLNEVCSISIDQCQSFGIYVCSADHTATECNAVPMQPEDEICDGIDNDCDDEIDEGGNDLCSDNLWCNGQETCAGILGCWAGAPRNIYDGISCTDDSCDETNDIIVNIINNDNCDNGLFCDGAETCDAQLDCLSGTPVDPDDGILCTEDLCIELTDEIRNIPNDNNCLSDSACADNYCDANLDCQTNYEPSTTQCRPALDECDTADFCTGFNADCPDETAPDGTECDDNFFCTVDDVCESGICTSSAQRDCSSNDFLLNECEYSPDSIDYTLDYYSFTAVCNEITNQCTERPLLWQLSITHECSSQCSAECIEDSDCPDTECDGLDNCIGNDYYDYEDVSNNCLANCECEYNACEDPITYEDDSRCISCGNNILDANEQCELPNTINNDYCSQTAETCDASHHTAVRDNYGNCNSACSCTEDSFSIYACISGSCGASCSEDIECDDYNPSTEDICNTDDCSCENIITSYCGDGNVDAGEECDDSNWNDLDGCHNNCMIEDICEYQCNPQDCNPYQCNPYQCNPYQCNPHNCNPYQCNPRKCNPHDCNCERVCRFGQCWEDCDTCYDTCYSTCYGTCYDTCYSTCYGTCYNTCYDTCEEYCFE